MPHILHSGVKAKLTTRGVQLAMTALAFKMFRFLMKCQDLEIIKVALAVVAPRTSQELIQCRSTSFLSHIESRVCVIRGQVF